MKTIYPCNYAVVRFLPYRETGEFVNLGVVLFCQATLYFDFKLETKHRQRVTDFFPELDKGLFQVGRDAFRKELQRIKELLSTDHLVFGEKNCFSVFQELVRHRESIFHFGEIGTALAEDPAQKLCDLFELFVNRQFAKTQEYQETIMVRKITKCLNAHFLLNRYRINQKIGIEEFKVSMPIVSAELNTLGVPRQAIKPLNLDRDVTTNIYDHGDAWIKKMGRLKKSNQLPDHTLFTIQVARTDAKRIKACNEVCSELQELGIRVLDNDDEENILKFARNSQSNLST